MKLRALLNEIGTLYNQVFEDFEVAQAKFEYVEKLKDIVLPEHAKLKELMLKVKAVFQLHKSFEDKIKQYRLLLEERKQKSEPDDDLNKRIKDLGVEIDDLADRIYRELMSQAKVWVEEIEVVLEKLTRLEKRVLKLSKKKDLTPREVCDIVRVKTPSNEDELNSILKGKRLVIKLGSIEVLKSFKFHIEKYEFRQVHGRPLLKVLIAKKDLFPLHLDLSSKSIVKEDMINLKAHLKKLIVSKRGIDARDLVKYLEEQVRNGQHDQSLTNLMQGKLIHAQNQVARITEFVVDDEHNSHKYWIGLDFLPKQIRIPVTPDVIYDIVSHKGYLESLKTKLAQTYIGDIENFIKEKDDKGQSLSELNKTQQKVLEDLKARWYFPEEELTLLARLSSAKWI